MRLKNGDAPMNKVLDLQDSEYRELISETARTMQVQPAIIEKDIWVCTVLQMLFSDPFLKDHLVFKGGTSLSKVYKLIHRFSEDIDLILDWRLFGYGEGERDPYSPRRSKTRQDKFNKEINNAAAEYLRAAFVPRLKQIMSDRDDIDVRISDSDSNAVEIMYPSIYSTDYIPSRILLEIGPLAAWVPSKWQRITPYVAEVFPQASGRIDINVLSTTAERTFWEKATILHQEAHRITAPPPRYSRHYYDLFMMARAQVKNREPGMKNVRTSLTDPLRIDWIETGAGGLIGMTFCPGKIGGSIHGLPWNRDLDLDLQVIQKSASLLVTLMEDHEFSLLGVEDLGSRAKRLGLTWLHLPIRDMSVPDEAFMEVWPEKSRYLRSLLEKDQNAVIHCLGGLGRTGVVAVMLLADMGIPAAEALEMVRSARPRTVETREQEEFCLSY